MFRNAPTPLLILLPLSLLGELQLLISPGPNVFLPLLISALIALLSFFLLRASRPAAMLLAVFLAALAIFKVSRIWGPLSDDYRILLVAPGVLLPGIAFSIVWLATAAYLLLSPDMRRYHARGTGET